MVKRGEIYFVNLDPVQGREQRGRRPVLIVSSDEINRTPLVVTVVVGTSGDRIKKDYPVNVRAKPNETGLPEETVFLCFQIRSIDPSRLTDNSTGNTKRVGEMKPQKMAEIEEALRLVLDL
jgi:mRNA interferase MazF